MRTRTHPHDPAPPSGTSKESRGTAYVVYDDIYDAKQACDHLSGFNVANRYLIVLYYNPTRQNKKVGVQAERTTARAGEEEGGYRDDKRPEGNFIRTGWIRSCAKITRLYAMCSGAPFAAYANGDMVFCCV